MVVQLIQGDDGSVKFNNQELAMTAAKSIEYRITQQLLRRREGVSRFSRLALVDRVIHVAAATAGLVFLGSYLQGLLWVVLAASAVLVLGIRTR